MRLDRGPSRWPPDLPVCRVVNAVGLAGARPGETSGTGEAAVVGPGVFDGVGGGGLVDRDARAWLPVPGDGVLCRGRGSGTASPLMRCRGSAQSRGRGSCAPRAFPRPRHLPEQRGPGPACPCVRCILHSPCNIVTIEEMVHVLPRRACHPAQGARSRILSLSLSFSHCLLRRGRFGPLLE